MTASLRRRPSTHAAPPLEGEDLLEEILIRLPPLPSSLPHASAVCKRWRGLVGDPRFASRFRIHHRRNPVKQCLAVIQVPMKARYGPGYCQTWDILAEGGGLCFVFQSTVGFYTTLWKRKKGCDGVYSRVRGTSIQLDELLSLKSKAERVRPWILGCAEDNNVVLLWTSIGVFTLQLESLRFKKLFESYIRCQYYPFEGVYTADTGIGGRQHGAELLHNTEDDYSE